MALRNILKEGDERLRKKSRPVTDFNERLWTLLDDMYETMKDGGVGIAAPQVGVLRRAVVIDVGEGKHEFVNPVIVEQSGDQCGGEGCLSIPGQYGLVHRPAQLRIKAQDRYGKPFELEAEGYFAVAVCHEVDHLDGILFIDKVERMLDPEEIGEE
ncbi:MULTISPECIES: peptide deformylase [Anaerotruncus]|jgi:peptide deformylase|uniref:Peptide deformylase n=1 Tax=Anaerotruncus colihominis TaxID=169435 RepID=A0A845RKK8_9FIRM|nr:MULTISPECIES: peptide deformylase [Anaerotruncus]MCI8492044.1 peptide deformylase [Anaerotruncus sp.]MCR2025449.1 peptide deformylase [Anaerotruncus colihominis]NBI79448.1 peptide deformylase [Anaerotruncus colihominis]NDO37924.1 peptide deformylase [Anaerotruncus colihominis]